MPPLPCWNASPRLFVLAIFTTTTTAVATSSSRPSSSSPSSSECPWAVTHISEDVYEYCGYDGGECFSCACVNSAYNCTGMDLSKYDCLGLEVTCAKDHDITSGLKDGARLFNFDREADPDFDCVVSRIGDGYCDADNNKEDCSYDGGDCCECTCVHGASEGEEESFACGKGGTYNCLDPNALCLRRGIIVGDAVSMMTNSDDASATNSMLAYAQSTDDGDDSGDSSASFSPTASPSANTMTTSSSPTEGPTEDLLSECDSAEMHLIGDGNCNTPNNIADCLYDGGDCCVCSCVNGPTYDCGHSDYLCLSPDADSCDIEVPITSASSAKSASVLTKVVFGVLIAGASFLGLGIVEA